MPTKTPARPLSRNGKTTKIDMPNDPPVVELATNASMELVAADAFTTDPSYDRPLNEPRVNKMAETWEPDGIGVVLASRREDEPLLYLIDGQHRVAALKKLGKKKQLVPTLLFSGLTVAQEAQLFVLFNKNRQRLLPSELFQASIASGDPGAIAIKEVLDGMGLTMHSTRAGGNNVKCVAAIWRIYNVMGADGVDSTLSLSLLAWGEPASPSAFNEIMLYAIARILHYAENKVDVDRLRNTLAKDPPEMWLNNAATIRSLQGGDKKKVLGELILNAYNKGLPHSRQIPASIMKQRKDTFNTASKFDRRGKSAK